MRWLFKRRMVPFWLRKSGSRGGLSLMEAAASFLILGISSVGAVKVFTLGRVGLESEYEYKMASELLRQKTEWMLGTIHSMTPSDWPVDFDNGDAVGEQVVIDYRGAGQMGAGIGNPKDVIGRIYYARVKEVNDTRTPSIPIDYFDVHTWIEWQSPTPSAWARGMAERPTGVKLRIDYQARMVPSWLE